LRDNPAHLRGTAVEVSGACRGGNARTVWFAKQAKRYRKAGSVFSIWDQNKKFVFPLSTKAEKVCI